VTIDVTLRFVLSTKIIRRTTWRRFGDDAAGDDGGDLLATSMYWKRLCEKPEALDAAASLSVRGSTRSTW
jgi:hypothetical protein